MVKVLIINKPEMVLKDDTYTHMYIKHQFWTVIQYIRL